MPNQDLFKAYQQGIKKTQKNPLKINPLSPAWERVRVRGVKDNHPHPDLPPSRGKEFNEYLFSTFSQHYKKLTSLPRKIRRALQKKWKHSLAGIALVLALGGTPAIGATFNVSSGNVGDLIDAITTANGNGEADVINLDGSTFTGTSGNYYAYESDNLFPLITSEITINGNGSTIERDPGAELFRFFALNTDGNLTLNNITLTGGSSDEQGGAIHNEEGEVTIVDSVLTGNMATSGGDDEGGAILTDGDTGDLARLTITNSVISNNTAGDDGGAIYDEGYTIIMITDSVITGNMALTGDGGGIYQDSDDGSELTIINTIISDNDSGDDGGNLHIRNNLTLVGSTLSDGMAGIEVMDGGEGGGINLEGGGVITVINSTISGNTAADEGGGIMNDGGDAYIYNSTIFGNTAGIDGGGVYNDTDDTTTLINTIVSGNDAPAGAEIFNEGTVNANSNNLFGHSGLTDAQAFVGFSPTVPTDINATSDGSNIDLVDILDTTLSNNGGPTETHALVSGSPALDSGNNGTCADMNTVNNIDQRGIDRPQNGTCDRGAFEFLDENNNNIDDCIDTESFQDLDQDGISDFCDTQIGNIAPAPTMSQWGMIAFGFIAGIFGLRFLRKKKELTT